MDPTTAVDNFNAFTAREGVFAGLFVVMIMFVGYFIWRFGNKLFDMLEKYLVATAASDLKTSVAVSSLAAALPDEKTKLDNIDDRLTTLIKALRQAAYVARDLVPETDNRMRDKLDQVIKDLE